MSTATPRFGNYLVGERLGAGGLAVVFKAKNVETEEIVALKILHKMLSEQDDVVARFQQEAAIVNHLQHAAIVPILDFGKVGRRPFMAMRYMAGGTMAARFKETASISSQHAVRVLRQISSALDYAHIKGVIHRDLKLENILLDERGDCYLSDFGIARINDSTRLTVTGSVVGTPLYMAPEQVIAGAQIDYRVDLYALAVIAYLLVVGRLPFVGENVVAIMHQHLYASPSLPSSVNLRLTPYVDSVLLRGLAKNPDDRYPSADMFTEAFAKAMTSVEQSDTMIDLNVRTDGGFTPAAPLVPGVDDSQLKSADEWFELARQASDREEAILLLRKVLEIEPWHAGANRALLKVEGVIPSTPPPPPMLLTDNLEPLKKPRYQRKQPIAATVYTILLLLAVLVGIFFLFILPRMVN